MDTKGLLDLFLQSGQELASKGKGLVDENITLPEDAGQRDAMIFGAKKGALATGALAMLLGTQSGRKLTGTTLKLGSLAAIGGIAYQTYQKWQAQQDGGASDPDNHVDALSGADLNKRSHVLLRAMVASAKADGHIDEQELEKINEQLKQLNLGARASEFLTNELIQPLNVQDIAAGADSPEAAAEIYLASRFVIDVDNEPEREYLDQLAQALDLAPELVKQLEDQVGA
ncbi:tellurite resistance TerB family protein [Methyloprofundus sp.]|uniref:tellurite resistance TerB family protein n=1 Tax=Methyloprofundus sp. TaxID=2020875 RepID=UPI003D0CE1EB